MLLFEKDFRLKNWPVLAKIAAIFTKYDHNIGFRKNRDFVLRRLLTAAENYYQTPGLIYIQYPVKYISVAVNTCWTLTYIHSHIEYILVHVLLNYCFLNVHM
jgi:hypothetical protein